MIENKKEFKLITKKNPKSLLPNALTMGTFKFNKLLECESL